MADYDISEAFQKIEEIMIASMSRNMSRHLKKEREEGMNYSMWQAEQLAALTNFRKNNEKAFGGYFSTVNKQIETILRMAHRSGAMDQETRILEAIRKGWKVSDLPSFDSLQGAFFKINERKLNALIEATTNDMKKAETAMLRMANDEYRKAIYNAEVYYNTGVGTLSQSVDMATKDFLSRGITCIEYANGARVAIDSYAKMALRTAQTRAYLQGEAAKRDEWGVSTVIVNKRGVACPRCLQWVGRVFYDDVWGNAPIPSPAEYPRLSEAIAGGLYHPNCKDVHTTYFEGISTPPEPMTEAEKKEAARVYNLEQEQRYNERQIRKYKRLSEGSVDPDNKEAYQKKLRAWQAKQREFVKANGDVLKRRYDNEKLRLPGVPEPPSLQNGYNFVTNTPKTSGTMNSNESDKSIFNDIVSNQSGLSKDYQKALSKKYSKGSKGVKKAFNKYVPKDSIADAAYSGTAKFSPSDKKIYMDVAKDMANARGVGTTFFHEHGHLVDFYARPNGASRVSMATPTFGNLLRSDYNAYIDGVMKAKGYKNIGSAHASVSIELMDDKHHSISDLFDALSGGKCAGKYGHPAKYWKNNPGAIEREAFAHMFEASFDKEKQQYMKQYFPKAYAEFEKLIKGVI